MSSIKSKRTFRLDVSDLTTSVNFSHCDDWVKTDPHEKHFKCFDVESGYMSHRQTPAFDHHFDHCFNVPKVLQQSRMTGKF